MLGVQSTTAGSSAPYLSPPRTGTLFPTKPPSTTTTTATAPPPASAPTPGFAATTQQHQQHPPPSSAPSLQPHYEYTLHPANGEMNGAPGEQGQPDQSEVPVDEGHSSPERIEQQSTSGEGVDTAQDVAKEAVNGTDGENGSDEALRTTDTPTDGNDTSSHPPEVTGEPTAVSDDSGGRGNGQTVGNDLLSAETLPAATAEREDSNNVSSVKDAGPEPAQASRTDSSSSDNAASAPEQNPAPVPAPEIERRMSSPLSELSPAPGEEEGEEGADNDEDADESNDQKTGSSKAEKSDPALLFADMMGPTPPSTSSSIYNNNHTNVNTHGAMNTSGHPHQRPINTYPYPPSSSASKLSQSHLYGFDPAASMGMNMGMAAGYAQLPGQLPMKGDANKKALAILELNAELLKICVAFQNNGIPFSVPEAQLYARKLNSNLTWLASRVDNSKSNIDIPELEPPILPPPGSTATSLSKDVLDKILPKETSDRIAALYSSLPGLFARDVAKRERRTQSQHQHHVQGVGTRGTPGPPTQMQMQPPLSAGGMHGVQAPHLQQTHSMQQGMGHVHGMPPPLATPTSSTGPPSGSAGVKRERVDSTDVHDAKRRDTGEGKRLSATPGPPLTPSASASASAVHTPQQQQLPLHTSHSMPPPPPPGSAGHGVGQGSDLMTRPGSARPASRAGDRGSPYPMPPTPGSADFGAGAPPGSGASAGMQGTGQVVDAHMRAQQMMHQQRILQQQRMAQQQRQQQGPLTPSQSGFPQQVQLGQQQVGQVGQQQQQHSQVQIPQAQQSPPPGMPGRRTPQQQAGMAANALSMTPPHMQQQANQQTNQGRPGEGTPVPGGPPALVQARQMSPPSSMGGLNPQAMGAQMGMGGMNAGGVAQGQPGSSMMGAGAGAGMGASMGNMNNMSNMPGASQQVLQQIMHAGPAAMTVFQQLQNPSNPMTIYLNQTYPGFSSLPVPEQMRRWQVVNQNMQQRRSQGMMSGQMAAGLGQMRPPTTAPGATVSGSMQPPSQSTPGRPGQGSQGQQMGIGMGMPPGRMGQPQVPGMNQGMSNAAALAGMQSGMANMPNAAAAMQNMNMANMSDNQRQQLMLMQMQARNAGNPAASGSGMMNPQMLAEQQRLAMQRAGAPGGAAGMNSPGGSGPTGGAALPGIARSSRPSSSAGAGGMGNIGDLAGGATPRLGGRALPGQQPGMGAPGLAGGGMGGMPGQGAAAGMGMSMGETNEYHRVLMRNAQQQQQYQLMQGGAGVGGMGAPGGLGPSAWPQQTQMSLAPGAWPQQGAGGAAQGFGGGDLSGMGGMGMMGMGAQRQMSATPAPGLAQQHSPTTTSSNEFEGMQMW